MVAILPSDRALLMFNFEARIDVCCVPMLGNVGV